MRALLLALALSWGAGSASADELKPFGARSWRDILAKHAGQPTIVHFWGMTCGPCRVEMPRLGDVLARHAGTEIVTVDTDLVAAPPGAAEAFLAAAKIPLADAWQFADPLVEKLYFSVDPSWQGEVPMTLLIGRDGRVTKRVGAIEAEELDRWVAAQR